METSVYKSNQKLMALQFVSGSMAACGAVTVTNPFDLLKTRRQLLNELGLGTGTVQKIRLFDVWTREGIKGLQRGLIPAYGYQILMNGTRFMIYEPSRLMLNRTMFGWGDSTALLANATAGAIAGGTGALIGTPFNLIKTRLQSYSPHFSTGYQHGYSGVTAALRSILAAEGIPGLYRGAMASVMRTTAGSAAQLSSYDWAKMRLAKVFEMSPDRFTIHLGAAMFSGVLACLMMNPFDVVMTRLYNQKCSGSLYTGVLDCALKTVRREGLAALAKGLVPHFVRVGPHTILTLVLLEQFRSLLRPLIL